MGSPISSIVANLLVEVIKLRPTTLQLTLQDYGKLMLMSAL